MAIRHFGQLLMDMSQYTWMLNDVVYAGLVPLILFLEDTEERVVKVSPEILFVLVLQRISVFYITPDGMDLYWPFSASQACKYTLKICASELKWSTLYFLKDEYYNFELVVLNICNNLVSVHSRFTTLRVTKTMLKDIQSDEKHNGHKVNLEGLWREDNKWTITARAWDQTKIKFSHFLLLYMDHLFFLPPTHLLWAV